MLANGLSLSPAVNEQTCTGGVVSDMLPNGVASSVVQQLNPPLDHNSVSHNNSGSKQQRIQMKRSYDEMSILRSLCSENHIIERETEIISGKRSRIGTTDESGRRSLQKSVKGSSFKFF